MVVTEAKDRRWQKMDRDKIDLLELARHFELYNRTEGKSDKTVIWYNQAITSFYRFLVSHKKRFLFFCRRGLRLHRVSPVNPR